MKKIYQHIKFTASLLVAILMIFTGKAHGQSLAFNQDEIIKLPGQTDVTIPGLGAGDKQTSRVYFDGLGRPVQTVAVKASPLLNDMIQPVLYNNLGQQTKSLLPYTGADGSGVYRANAVTDQATFYSSAVATPAKIAADASPFSQQVFENSPLQRVLKSGLVGAGFQPVGGSGTQHYKTAVYRPNSNTADGNIIMWGPDGSNTGNYADNALSVTDGTDEDGQETLVYTDLAGRTVLKRRKNSTANNDTYYIYNDAGAVSYVIPPLALEKMVALSNYDPNQAVVNKLIFIYKYDEQGRVIEKNVPGAGVVTIVYDPLSRPVLVQDARLNGLHEWNYIKYDAKDNPISQGIYTDNTHLTRADMQNYVNGMATAYDASWYEVRASSATTGYYTNTIFPTTGIAPLAYSYFDNYRLGSGTGAITYTFNGQGTGAAVTTATLKGVPTITRMRTMGPGTTFIWLIKVMFYDKYGHLIEVQGNNQLGSGEAITDLSTSLISFAGATTQTKVTKVTGTTTPATVSVVSNMFYDHMFRVTSITQSYDGGATAAREVAAYIYNELGQLIDKKLGNVSGSTYLQSVDLRYNIRGQLTNINNSNLLDDDGNPTNDLFGMQVLYNIPDPNLGNTTYFNGKLSAVKWISKDATGTAGNERAYKYLYDGLDRYRAANYAERTTPGTGSFGTNTNAFSESSITYDSGGNLLTLKRAAIVTAGGSVVNIDNLMYTYDTTNPNRLSTVMDGTSANFTGYGFRNLTGATTTVSYIYDENGNLTNDPYKGLAISYNDINRTKRIDISGTGISGRHVDYTYTATGSLIEKQQYDAGTLQTTTDYIDGFVYINGTLSYFGMPEGRVRNTGTGTTVTLKPEFVISDQQGNARVSFEDNGSGVAVVRQENSYYGFGLIMPNSAVTTPTTPNKQLYNGGSEWQNDFANDLPGYYQTFYRNYDAAIGRFVGVDPMAESAESLTSYNYAGDNPIVFNDPMGDYPPGIELNPEPGEPMHGGGFGLTNSWSENQVNSMTTDDVTQMDDGRLQIRAASGDIDALNEYSRRNGGTNIAPNQLHDLATENGEIGFYKAVGIGFYNPDHSGVTDANGFYNGNAYNVWQFVPISATFESRHSANQGGGWGYTHAALGASAVLAGDDITGVGVIDDIAIPFIVVGAVAHDLYTNGIVSKMAREIDRIAEKAKGPQGFTYALVAKSSGLYPNVRGGTTFLNAGDVWKFGQTTSGSRYSDNYLNGARLQQINLFPGNQMEIRIQEKIMIYGYFMEHGTLPAGNSIFR